MNKQFKMVCGLALPGLIGFLLFYILPYMLVLWYSLSAGDTTIDFIGLKNYIEVMQNEYFRQAIINTSVMLTISVPYIIIISYVIVIIMKNNRYNKLFLLLQIIPLLVPSASIADLWNEILPLDNMWSIICLFIWRNQGLISVIISAGMQRIPKEIYDAAAIDGTSEFRLQKNIIFPQMIPVILFSVLVCLIQSFKIFREIYLVHHDYPPREIYFIPHFIFNKFNKLDYGELASGTILFTLVIIGILFLLGLGYILVYWSDKKRKA